MTKLLFAVSGLSIVLLAGLLGTKLVGQPEPTLACAAAVTPSVAADYFYYHALVSPRDALSGTQDGHPSCPPLKVIRT
jgi:hypothetical protein